MFKSLAAVAMMGLLGAPTPADVKPATGPGTRYYDGPPPIRFIKEQFVPVLFIHPSRMNEACGMPNMQGMVLVACARPTRDGIKVVIMPHPALSMHDNPYALVLAHELAHTAGWDGAHPL